MADFTIKRGDTRPAMDVPIDRGGVPVALASTSQSPLTPSRILMLARPNANHAGAGITGTMSVASAAGGVPRYTWLGGDTATSAMYDFEVEVVWSDGGIETFPEGGYLSLDITEDLGGS